MEKNVCIYNVVVQFVKSCYNFTYAQLQTSGSKNKPDFKPGFIAPFFV